MLEDWSLVAILLQYGAGRVVDFSPLEKASRLCGDDFRPSYFMYDMDLLLKSLSKLLIIGTGSLSRKTTVMRRMCTTSKISVNSAGGFCLISQVWNRRLVERIVQQLEATPEVGT